MTESIPLTFHDKLEELKKYVEHENTIGNLDGLFSQYVLKSKIDVEWSVVVTENLLEQYKETIEQGNYIHLAILGYSLFLDNKIEQFLALFKTGLQRLKSKNPFPRDRISFPFFPREFLGIILGIVCLTVKEQKEQRKWLLGVLLKRMSMNMANPLHKIMYKFIGSILSEESIELTSFEIRNIASYPELCLVYWGYRIGAFQITDTDAISEIKRRVLEGFIDENVRIDRWLIPIIYFSVKSCLLESIDPAVLSPDHVSRLLNNFESAMQRWPYTKERKWPITDEKDVQSIVWLILRSVFDDVVYEEPTYRFGHGYSLVDFRIPLLRLLIEIKYVRTLTDFRRIEDEIKIDSINYLQTTDCTELIVFIFDESASVEEHQTTIQSLKRIEGIKDVIVVSRPSHIVN